MAFSEYMNFKKRPNQKENIKWDIFAKLKVQALLVNQKIFWQKFVLFAAPSAVQPQRGFRQCLHFSFRYKEVNIVGAPLP